MNLKESTRYYAVLKAVEKLVKAKLAHGKDMVAGAFDENGAKSAVASLTDGTEVATVTMAAPTPKPFITNERDLIEWLKANTVGIVMPERTIVEPETIDGGAFAEFVKSLNASDGILLDDNGEIVPGVHLRAGEPYPTVRFKPGGEAAIAAAWVNGTIGALLPAVAPALMEGGDE